VKAFPFSIARIFANVKAKSGNKKSNNSTQNGSEQKSLVCHLLLTSQKYYATTKIFEGKVDWISVVKHAGQ
jgi:hypothetical protein